MRKIRLFALAMFISLTASFVFASQRGKPELLNLDALIKQSSVILIGEVEEIGPSPGFWSGYVQFSQTVKYKKVNVLKGEISNQGFVVHHLIYTGSPVVQENQPKLKKDFFVKGKKLILFVDQVNGQNRPVSFGKKNLKRNEFVCESYKFGTIEYSSEFVDEIRKKLIGDL